jgi:hypothetical protein
MVWKFAVQENKAMKPKLLLCLALVLSGGFILCHADETNAIPSPTTVAQQRPNAVSFAEVLQESSVKLGCHFTLEYRDYAMTARFQKSPSVNSLAIQSQPTFALIHSRLCVCWFISTGLQSRLRFKGTECPQILSNEIFSDSDLQCGLVVFQSGRLHE